MSKSVGAVCLLLFSVFISSVSQILLKKAANKTYKDHIREYINPLVIFAYGMFFGSVILTGKNLQGCENRLVEVLSKISIEFIA